MTEDEYGTAIMRALESAITSEQHEQLARLIESAHKVNHG